MLVLSIAWLAIVVIELGGNGSPLLTGIGTAIWIIFIVEFAVRFALAPAKMPFLRSNWLTLIALAVPALRIAGMFVAVRAASALRGFRLVRIVGTANRSMNALRLSLKRRQAGYVALLTAVVVLLGAAGMLSFEPASEVEGGFTSYGDAVWWTVMLISSIGSAYWPVTSEGRLLTALLGLYGLGVIGYIAATFASFFVGRDAQDRDGPVAGRGELESISKELRELSKLLGRMQEGRDQ